MRIRSLLVAGALGGILAAAMPATGASAEQAFPAGWTCTPGAAASYTCTAAVRVPSVAASSPGSWAAARAKGYARAQASAAYLTVSKVAPYFPCKVEGKTWVCQVPVTVAAATPAAGSFPTSWQHCQTPAGSTSTIACDAVVTLPAKALAEANRLCRSTAADQAKALGYRNVTAANAIAEKRRHGRYWCRVFLGFEPAAGG